MIQWIGPREINYLILYGVYFLEEVSEVEISALYNIMDKIIEMKNKGNRLFTPFYTDGQAIVNLCIGYELFENKLFPPCYIIGPDAPPKEEIELKAKEIAGEAYNCITKILERAKEKGENREKWLKRVSGMLSVYHWIRKDIEGKKLKPEEETQYIIKELKGYFEVSEEKSKEIYEELMSILME